MTFCHPTAHDRHLSGVSGYEREEVPEREARPELLVLTLVC